MKFIIKLSIYLLTSACIICAQVPTHSTNFKKLSSGLQRTICTQTASAVSLAKIQDTKLKIILRINSIPTMSGLKIHSVVGNIATAEISSSQLPALLEQRQVEYIQEDNVERPSMYSNAQLMNVEDVQRGILNSTPLRGKNVILVIYDSGIDWQHLDFRRTDDTTKSRILAIWDQIEQTDASHHSPSGFEYGVEYHQTDLNAELSGSSTGYVRTTDRTGHGTAVAGIAAANGQSSSFGFSGTAPDADLIIIKGGDETFSEAKIIDGINYAAKKAKELGKPVVLNLSLGSQFGAHDGSRLYEQAIDAFASTPGHAVTVAAGNDGDLFLHAECASNMLSDSATMDITIPSYVPQDGELNDLVNLEFYYDAADSIVIQFVSPSGKRVSASTGQAAQFDDSPEGTILLTNASYGPSALNGMNIGDLQLFDYNYHLPAVGTWKVVVKNAHLPLHRSIHFWITEGHVGTQRVYFDRSSAAVNSAYLVSSPGNSAQAITVGSFNVANKWTTSDLKIYELGDSNGTASSFSAAGPRIDGMIKPEVVAPGVALGTTLAHTATTPTPLVYKDGCHIAAMGTSFSAPQIAGLVALMFQVDPALTNERIKETLRNSAFIDQALQSASTQKYGYGKINGLTTLLSLLHINYLSPEFLHATETKANQTSTRLQWTRNMAKSLAGFEILRRTNATDAFINIASYKDSPLLKVDTDSSFQFIDAGATDAMYIIREVDILGREENFGIISRQSNTDVSTETIVPKQFVSLLQNYPNPFNPSTLIKFQNSTLSTVSLKIYDIAGREIASVIEGQMIAGTHTVIFDGSKLASGTYVYILKTNGSQLVKKMQLIK